MAKNPRWRWDQRTTSLVVLIVVAVALYPVGVSIHAVVYGADVGSTMLLGAAAAGAPLLSTRYPRAAVGVFTAAATILPLTTPDAVASGAPWPWSVPMLIAFAVMVAAVTLRHGWVLGLIAFTLGTVSGIVVAALLPVGTNDAVIVTTSVVAGVYLVSVLLASRLRLGDELTRERADRAQEQARREVMEERTRIARELHDVVAHSMSVVQVQASTARYRLPELSPAAAAEFDAIAAAARGALVEMRHVLGVLRTEDHAAELSPQRGIADIPDLVEATRRAGADATAEVATAGEPAAATQLAAYRIVQEALSNAVRHAPGSAVTVTVDSSPDEVRLTVRNGRSPARPAPLQRPSATAGHGLRGMTERAASVGGEVDAGPDADGGWTVRARLPRTSSAGSAASAEPPARREEQP